MGRPLAKRFFSGGTGATIGCSFHDGSSVIESAIISQRSNSQFRVAGTGGTPLTFTDLTFANTNPDTITRNGGVDLTLTFSAGDSVRVASSENSGENDGVYEIAIVTSTVITLTDNGALVVSAAPPDTAATLALVSSVGVLGRLVQGAPVALGEMQITAQRENAQTPTTADIAFTSASGTGVLLTVQVDNVAAHYGYWTAGTAVGIAGTTDGTVDYTVANGKIATVVINTAGSANVEAESPVALDDAAIANPPLQSVSKLQARTIQTFEGNRYDWPITAPLGDSQALGSRTQCNLQGTDL